MLTHREFEPLVEELSDRFRLVLPDLPLHGDSEDRPRHPYTPDWMAEVIAGFCREVCGPRPLVGGHDVGALILLRAVADAPAHARPARADAERAAPPPDAPAGSSGRARRRARRRRAGGRPRWSPTPRGSCSARRLGERADRARQPGGARPRAPRASPTSAATPTAPAPGRARRAAGRPARSRDLLDAYELIDVPTLLLWADEDRLHPVEIAEEALGLLPDAQLRVLPGTGFLMAYDDPVGMARELAAFCT